MMNKSDYINNLNNSKRMMRCRNILLLGICMFLLITVISAEEKDIGVFKQGSCIYLLQTCANCSYVKIDTVQTPTVNLTINENMFKNGVSSYNYKFCDTSELGEYIYNTIGDPEGMVTVQPVSFTITTTGSNSTNVVPIFLFIGAIVLFIFAFIDKNEYIGFFSACLFLVSGVYMMIYGLGLFADDYTRAISFVTLGMGLSIGFSSAYEMFYSDEEE